MALYRPSAIITAITGTLGSVTFAVGNKRLTLRKSQRQPAASAASLAAPRAAIAYLNHLWLTQTDATRAAWTTLAATLRSTDALGLARQPSGRALFLAHNLPLLRAGITLTPSTIPTAADTTTWTGIAFNITNPTTAHVDFLQPLFGPYAKANIYGQTFFRPTPQITQPLFQNALGPIPKKWKYLANQPGLNNAGTDLGTPITTALGAIKSGQRVAILCRWTDAATFASTTYTAIATCP